MCRKAFTEQWSDQFSLDIELNTNQVEEAWLRGIVQGYLAHTKQRPPRTLQWDYAQGPMEALWGGGGCFS